MYCPLVKLDICVVVQVCQHGIQPSSRAYIPRGQPGQHNSLRRNHVAFTDDLWTAIVIQIMNRRSSPVLRSVSCPVVLRIDEDVAPRRIQRFPEQRPCPGLASKGDEATPSPPYVTISATPSPSRSPTAGVAGEAIQSTTVSPSTSTPPSTASTVQSVPRRMRSTPSPSV